MMLIRLFFSLLVLLSSCFSAAQAEMSQSKVELVYLTEPAGEELFFSAALRDHYFKLASYVETEQILTFCGPATIAGVMNSLDVERPVPIQFHPWKLYTQDSIFTPENQAVKPYPMVEHEGLLLNELAQFFINLGVKAIFKHADEISVEEFRDTVKSALSNPNQRLVVNYTRVPLGQVGGGHISPVAAYDELSDRVLILDVAKYKYPPVWMKVADIYNAMATVDDASGKMRGIVVVTQ